MTIHEVRLRRAAGTQPVAVLGSEPLEELLGSRLG